jgi:phosphoribosylcarboxyaminoimidazole (NCAIR) mutase
MLFRYQPLAYQPDSGAIHLWDRLLQRECVSPRPATTNVTGIACSKSEITALQARIDSAERAEQQRAAQAASEAAYQQALATAGGDAHLARQVEALKAAQFPADDIAAYVAVQQLGKTSPSMAATIERARASGYSEAQIDEARLAHAAQADVPK